MTTLAALIEQTRQRLKPGRRDTLNKLNGDITAIATSLVLSYDAGVAPSIRYSVDLEDIYAWDADSTTKTVSPMERGFNGSTAATHTSGALVYVNAEITPFEIVRAFNEVLDALPGEGVYKFATVDLTGSSSLVGYDLTSVGNLLGVHRVRYKDFGGYEDWITIPRDRWTVRQSMPVGDFASGESLSVYEDVAPGQTLEVLYKTVFTHLAALTDDVEAVTGVPATMHGLLVVGAALRLLQGRPVERAAPDAQGLTRRPQEVTTTDTRSSVSPLELEWQRAVLRARKELLRRHGA